MHLAQHRLQRPGPGAIQLAKPAVAIARRMRLPIFLPEQLQRDVFAPQLAVNRRPVRQRLGRRAGQPTLPADPQSGHQLGIGQAFGQGPAQPGGLGALEIIAHRAGGQTATARNLAQRQLVLVFQSKDVFNVTHCFRFSCHRSLSKLQRGTSAASPHSDCVVSDSFRTPFRRCRKTVRINPETLSELNRIPV